MNAKSSVCLGLAVCFILSLEGINGFSAKLSPHWNNVPPGGNSITARRRSKTNRKKSVRRDYSKQEIESVASKSEEGSDKGSNADRDNSNLSVSPNNNIDNDVDFPNAETTLQAIQSYYRPEVQTEAPKSAPVWSMIRPSNFPGVIALHILGVSKASNGLIPLWRALLRPSSVLTLFSLLIIASSSMMVNDYYDARTGVDKFKPKPFVSPRSIKRTLSRMYAVLLLTVAFLPGTATRLSVLSAAMLTYWYTQHLKPRTWLKNVSCASIMAMAPFTSAASISTGNLFSSVGRLVATLFFGFFAREMWMDIVDAEADARSGILTVPVKYGKLMASRTAGMSICAMAFFSLFTKPKSLTALPIASSVWMLGRAYQIVQTEGLNPQILNRAINEAKVAFMFILGSFL